MQLGIIGITASQARDVYDAAMASEGHVAPTRCLIERGQDYAVEPPVRACKGLLVSIAWYGEVSHPRYVARRLDAMMRL